MINKTEIRTKARLYLNEPDVSVYSDSRIDFLRDLVIDAIENYLYRKIVEPSYSVTETIFVDKRKIFVPIQYTPLLTIVSPEFKIGLEKTVIYLKDDYELRKSYEIEFTYGDAVRRNDIELIIEMMIIDFDKRSGRSGLQGITSKSTGANMNQNEQNYLKEIFTNEYKETLKPYRVPELLRDWF